MPASQSGDAGSLAILVLDLPRGGICLPGKTAADRLRSPAVHIANATRLPQQVRSINPGPEKLPNDREPPLPALRAVHACFIASALYRVVEQSIARVELLGPKIDKECKQKLDKTSAKEEKSRTFR
jgi:hypothetical protein